MGCVGKVGERLLDVLDVLHERGEAPLGDLAHELGLHKSTVSRQLALLEERGLVVRTPLLRFRLGYRVLQWASRVRRDSFLTSMALPGMLHLRDLTGETIGLHVRTDDGRVCVEQVESRHDLRRTLEIGRPYPLLPGAVGKAIAAFLPEEQWPKLIERAAATNASGEPIHRRQLRRDLDEVRRHAYAWSRQELVRGGAGIAFPLFDATGQPVGALNISAPVERFPSIPNPAWVKAGRNVAQEISEQLGWTPPDPARKSVDGRGAARLHPTKEKT